MSSSGQFKYTLDKALPDVFPRKMAAAAQHAFTDKDVFKQELDRVFDSDWVMMGRAGAIPNPAITLPPRWVNGRLF